MKKSTNNSKLKTAWTKVKNLRPGMKIAVPKNKALALHYQSPAFREAGTEKGQGDILWDEIMEIKKLPAERVYDIEVRGTHNFVANGIFAHNTYLDGNATTTGSLVVGNPTGGGKGAGSVNAQAYYTNGVDYAEYFYTKDIDLQPGEVVSIDVTNPNAVSRSNRVADPNVIGIISSKPGIVAGEPGENNEKVIVGLLGQVPARASAENGEIRPGDSLTSASLPGYVMKANAGDSTVGVALESLTKGEGTIQVLISRRNKSLTVEQVEEKVQERIAGMEIEDEVNIMVASAMENLGMEEQLKEVRLKVEELEKKNMDLKIAADFDNINAGNVNILENLRLTNAGNILFNNFGLGVSEDGKFVLKSLNATSTLVFEVQGKVKAKEIAAEKAFLNELVFKAATSTASSTEDRTDDRTNKTEGAGEVRVKVVEKETGDINLNVNAGAEFEGQVSVKDLEVKGKVVVHDRAVFKKDVAIEGSLELSGAIIKQFKIASSTALEIGDVVYVSGSNQVDRAYADNPEFKPGIGVVVGFGQEDDRSDRTNRTVRVAVSGTVSGFKDLVPGARYYLADLTYYYEHRMDRTDMRDKAEGINAAGLRATKPREIGSVIQPMAVAISDSELLIMPSLDYKLSDEEMIELDFENVLQDKSFESLVEEITETQAEIEQIEQIEQLEIPVTQATSTASSTEDSTEEIEGEVEEEHEVEQEPMVEVVPELSESEKPPTVEVVE